MFDSIFSQNNVSKDLLSRMGGYDEFPVDVKQPLIPSPSKSSPDARHKTPRRPDPGRGHGSLAPEARPIEHR
ncbi:MAG: hypothetical protein ABFD00_09475, partial [Chloroherpetonaceae bacterium]